MSAVKRRILLVDDEPVLRAALFSLLTAAGYHTLTASSVPEATDILEEAAFDLLITDVRVDGWNGLQLAAMNTDRFPVIVLTGYHDPATAEEANRLGATFLEKPVTGAALLQLIAETLLKPRDDRADKH